MAGSMLETDRHCCVDVAGMESGQIAGRQHAADRQTYITALMLQAWRVDRWCGRQHAAAGSAILPVLFPVELLASLHAWLPPQLHRLQVGLAYRIMP